jgi:hypothetical protein
VTTPPTIPLPLRGRTVALTDRACWGLLGAAMVGAAGLILWLNRGTTFSLDQVDFVEDSPGLEPGDVLEPHNGHLVATTRLVYKAVLETVGIDFLTFRLLGVITLLLAVGAFYALVKRRIGAGAALAPSVVLLLFGSAWHHVVVPIGFTNLLSVAAGLGALLVLERRDRGGDLAACALATLSVATFSTGVAFLAGVAVLVLLGPDRWRRAWVFLVPAVLYAAWWVHALSVESPAAPDASLANVLVIPSYLVQSLAAVTAALGGLNYDFADPAHGRELGWGYVLGVLAVIALALRVGRGGVPPALWASLAILLVYWSLLALSVDPFVRPPGALRYMYMGAVGVLLVAAAAAAPLRLSGRGLAVLFAVAAFSLVTNLALLREGAAQYREEYSARAQAQFAALELARGHVDPAFDPAAAVPPDVSPVSSPAGTYFEVVDRYGSPAFTISELERQRESTREVADRILAAALDLRLEAPPEPEPRPCFAVRAPERGGTVDFELPPEGAVVRARGAAVASLAVGRFAAAASVELGDLAPEEPAAIRVPPDDAPRPWRVTVDGAEAVGVCPLP